MKPTNSKTIILLGLIVFLGGLFRLWRLGQFPVSLSMDETSVSYDSYSILTTGKDMYGNFLPLAFKSVGDFKSPVLTYLMLPAIRYFGLTEFGTRITVALISTLTLIFACLLVWQMTGNKLVSLLTTFSLAISPWHIQYSRATFDYIVADTLLIIAVWSFLKSIKNQSKHLWLSAVFFSLSAYSYHAERLMVPLLVVGLSIIFKKKLLEFKKSLVIAIAFGLLVSLPLISILLRPEGQTRAASVFISQDVQINDEVKSGGSGKFLNTANFWVKRYLNYWDLRFIFLDGSRFTQPGSPDVGLFHLYEVVPFIFGIWVLFISPKSPINQKSRHVIILWLILGPLAASLTNNEQHAGRALSTIPTPQLIVGLGYYFLLRFVRRFSTQAKLLIGIFFSSVVLISLVYFLDIYTVQFPAEFSEYWGYGQKEAIQYALQNQESYQEIIIDPSYGTSGQTTIDAPYLYALYFSRYDPGTFQTEPRRSEWKDSMNFGKFTFRSIYWPKDCRLTERLFIGSPWSLPLKDLPVSQIKKRLYFKNGVLGFLIVSNPFIPENCPKLN